LAALVFPFRTVDVMFTIYDDDEGMLVSSGGRVA
jgi:hypothetical protein